MLQRYSNISKVGDLYSSKSGELYMQMNHFSIELNCLKLVQIIVQIANLNCLLLAFSIEESPPTLEYLITVQHLLNVHNGKLSFIWLAKKDNLMLLN